ncbi:MAG: molybdopterin-guanine dinucleotide biosynthesis protein MobB [Pyrinomonadaceae bacterium]|nr:molybdopterin-guanine dinucleotide biosynthesis protein MobB [Sphingobacteriaceae bacterium]
MHINITKSEAGNNKGSSSQLISYLEKENRMYLDQHTEPEYWFNQQRQNIQPYEVRHGIDNNIAKLSKDDAKFFLINISPSEKEIKYLKKQYGEEGAEQQLKEFANKVMDEYAKNFKRNNINGNNDLVYFGKQENNRYYTYKDLEVRKGTAKKGDPKPGEQMHIQIIVSRKDATNSIKLSPLNNSKGKNQLHSQKVGQFDRTAFKQSAETLFDKAYGYERELKETFTYANTLKHGSYEQKREMKESHEKQVKQQQQHSHHNQAGILNTLLRKVSEEYMPNIPQRRKKKKKNEHNQGLGL